MLGRGPHYVKRPVVLNKTSSSDEGRAILVMGQSFCSLDRSSFGGHLCTRSFHCVSCSSISGVSSKDSSLTTSSRRFCLRGDFDVKGGMDARSWWGQMLAASRVPRIPCWCWFWPVIFLAQWVPFEETTQYESCTQGTAGSWRTKPFFGMLFK